MAAPVPAPAPGENPECRAIAVEPRRRQHGEKSGDSQRQESEGYAAIGAAGMPELEVFATGSNDSGPPSKTCRHSPPCSAPRFAGSSKGLPLHSRKTPGPINGTARGPQTAGSGISSLSDSW